ncbi:MAG: DNA alkylation repair protein [Candidatus Pacebacteria bacterium]|nr:DNA alkylation repair protein [Candidatus Paceibacterota bacterium]
MEDNKLGSLRKVLADEANENQAKILQGFFKTGKGEYGEGDVFWGIKVPVQRMIVRGFYDLEFGDVKKLLESKIHEERFCALLILMKKYEQGDADMRKNIFDFYIRNSKKINNWDLVDVSAPKILGYHLLNKDRGALYELAKSDNLWQRRIAIIATLAFIRKNDFGDTLKIAEILLFDEHDLMHKAVGWMLREVGKRDLAAEEIFLLKYHKKMPRTMLRYAIERFDKKERESYLVK